MISIRQIEDCGKWVKVHASSMISFNTKRVDHIQLSRKETSTPFGTSRGNADVNTTYQELSKKKETTRTSPWQHIFIEEAHSDERTEI
jgi:hypothetical protein